MTGIKKIVIPEEMYCLNEISTGFRVMNNFSFPLCGAHREMLILYALDICRMLFNNKQLQSMITRFLRSNIDHVIMQISRYY